MNRDLPYVACDVPSNSEHVQQFANIRRISKKVVTSIAGAFLAFAVVAPIAYADPLDDQRNRVNEQIEQNEEHLHEHNAELEHATQVLDSSRQELAAAQEKLAQTRAELAAAEEADRQAAADLQAAEIELRRAIWVVNVNQVKVETQRRIVGENVRASYQQNSELVGMALWVDNLKTSDLAKRNQWTNQALRVTDAEFERLERLQAELDQARAARATAEREEAAKRAEAAKVLTDKQQLAEQAAAEETALSQAVAANEQAEADARAEVEKEQARREELLREQAEVEKQIQERIERERAEAARKAEEERLARERAAQERAEREAADRRAAEDRAAADRRASAKPKEQPSAPRQSNAAAPSSSIVNPVSNVRITSKFGYRVHPILKTRRMHDGTDFGASCGTPLIAIADGVVTSKVWNNAYGNRMIVDFGRIDGKNVTAAYNHATRYTVGKGDRVRKGQTIGYVGTTGWSTGCHLHFTTWVNGNLTDPMTIL
ncbi:M23 family metallopeptidase [Parenemella sanctibonifatiensis]|uniref:M23ase beta-sheet core domain-containing protein n=1 Tax=Parenemella sanctibonifatiensis TaxID=2016505 RepID=A0A255EH54_9ACTN|nr:M23 family metallopeptidase [Parenemella sanctibonifatiensis]OYN90867.1 hypothetical protein CGZ91_05070 [Parenemella sanctibonifatiensis]